MNMRITTPSNRFTNSNGRHPSIKNKRITNNDGWRFDRQNKSHDRLENGDRRRVSFGAPQTATMNVDDYDHEDEIDLIKNEQFLLETEQFFLQTEEYDNPNVNAVESAMKKCTVCKQEDHKS